MTVRQLIALRFSEKIQPQNRRKNIPAKLINNCIIYPNLIYRERVEDESELEVSASCQMLENGRDREQRILSDGYSGLNYKGGVIYKPAKVLPVQLRGSITYPCNSQY